MDYTRISKKEILDWLKSNLTEKRYEHSIGCAECAVKLAKEYGLDEEKAYIAGLLHDCAKCFDYEKSVEIINKFMPDVKKIENLNFKTIHAPVSAYVAKTEFGISDEEILSSIRWHTIGKKNMTDFEKIIFLSDKVENRTRKAEYRNRILPALEISLDKAILICYKETIKSLVERDLKICQLTVDLYNELEDKLQD